MQAVGERRRSLVRDARGGDAQAREQIVREYQGLLQVMASRYRELGLPVEDLVQEGAIGLLAAIDRFDGSRGASFETFARAHVRHAIMDALTSQGRLVRLPKQVVERRRAVTRAASALTARSGHVPTSAEITAVTGLPIESVEAIQALPATTASLDLPVAGGDETILELTEDPTATDPEVETLALHRAEVIAEALDRLPDREQEVIRRRYGFGRLPQSLVEVSEDMHLCPQRARAIEQTALYRLAKMLERDPTFQRAPWRDWTLTTSRRPAGIDRRQSLDRRRRRTPPTMHRRRASMSRRPGTGGPFRLPDP
jgi:RNA polymerase primary sigma factor